MQQHINKAKVTLVGAGPGASDLITVRGFKVLRQADVVLYDALVDKSLLNELDDHIHKIYVGKRCGKHSLVQEDINKLIVESALGYGHVVRLKGGDPFVFGRGAEEIEYIESFGIPVEVVPGLSSAIAVPAGQGIPLTKRGVSNSFWVVTATTEQGGFSKDFQYAAQSTTTMVILMGIRKLSALSRAVRKHRGGDTPVAIIQNGTLTSEACSTGVLNNVEALSTQVDTNQPGIIIIGNVVAEHPAFFEETIQRVISMEL
ncbi:uroporphyrinogen-III C-methyltransferase [Flagellimonas sp. MMG031]|uniref:uroporphyrinogen-III C-methyltransferase n=1 Tax=Flagellimonas sp. MMG031 TaxID=3158549 RepID=A0AAU7MWN9_9FLAO